MTATKRTLYPAAKAVLSAWDRGEGDLAVAILGLREAIAAEHRASAERARRSQVRRMDPEERARLLAKTERRAAALRGED